MSAFQNFANSTSPPADPDPFADGSFSDPTSPQPITNLTSLVNATLSNANITVTVSNGTSTNTTITNTETNATETVNGVGVDSILGAVVSSVRNATVQQGRVDPNAIALQTYGDVQRGYLNAAIFGGLVCWGLLVLLQACKTFYHRRKPLYFLNTLQCSLTFIKTLSAALYAVVLNLDCSARSPLMNVPLVLAWDCIYGIMLMKLLLFARWKLPCQIFYAVGVTTHFVLVMVAISQRQWKMNSLGLCGDKYGILYKQQYVIELIIESVTAVALLHGLAYHGNRASGVLSGTQHVLKQLAQNEHLRVFFVMIFISLKIASSYAGSVNVVAITHSIDSARSALVCWALIREQRKVAKTAAAEHEQLSNARNSSVTPSLGASAKKLSTTPSKMVVSKFAATGGGGGGGEGGDMGRVMLHHPVSRGVSGYPTNMASSVPRRTPGAFDMGRMASVAGSVPKYLKGTGGGDSTTSGTPADRDSGVSGFHDEESVV